MGNFTYEVVENYAENEGLKVRAVSYNGREPKFDIRHWATKDGEETMGKGVTLTLEELMWLAKELPNVAKKIMGDETSNEEKEDDTESEEENEEESEEDNKAVQFMQFVVQSAKEKEPENEGLHGVIDVGGMSYASNKEIILKLNVPVSNIEQVDDNPKLRNIVSIVEKAQMKGLNIGEINKFKAAYRTIEDKKGEFFYSFGKGKPAVNARYLGRSLDVLGGKIKYDERGLTSVISDKGTSIIQPMSNDIEEVGLIEV
jgi:hypothetical protein